LFRVVAPPAMLEFATGGTGVGAAGNARSARTPMAAWRDFFDTRAGKAVAVAVVLAGVLLVYLAARRTLGPSEIAAMSRDRLFVCVETGRTFRHRIEPGMAIPVRSPYTGQATGYEAEEMCLWTRDGGTRAEPTWVVLNKTLGKSGPTFC